MSQKHPLLHAVNYAGTQISSLNPRRAVCGKLIRDRDRWMTVPSFNLRQAMTGLGPHVCRTCRRLSPMPDAERDIAMAELVIAKRVKLDELKLRSSSRKAQERDVHIEFAQTAVRSAREDAIVCLDVWESTGRFLTPDPLLEMALADGSMSEARMARLNKIDTGAVLAGAVVAHRLANPKSRGKRLWIFRSIKDGSKFGRVHCRFCDQVLESETVLGENWTNNPEVKQHTVTCALRYLIGMPLVGQAVAS